MKRRPTPILHTLRETVRRKPAVSAVYFVLRALVILTMIRQFINGDYENVFLCALTLVLFLLPTIIEHRLRIDFPDTMEIVILLFIFAAEILGEIRSYYTTFPGWDTVMHTLNGFLCAAVGFSLVDMLDRNERFSLSLSPVFLALVAIGYFYLIGRSKGRFARRFIPQVLEDEQSEDAPAGQ